ncbi:MAG: hypothetical protein IPK82_43955 [Polyangiaceae bacterium]|nr:hypothetical protein [Polyangiaceae bacterium]
MSAIALAVLCVLGLWRSVRFDSIWQYNTDLHENLLKIPPPGIKKIYPGLGWGGRSAPELDRVEYEPGPDGQRTTLINDVKVFQSCATQGCRLILGARWANVPDANAFGEDVPLQGWGEEIRITRNGAGSTLFVGRVRGEFRLVDGYWKAFPFSPERVAARSSMPSLWLGAGWIGLVLVGLLRLLRRRLAADERRLQNARSTVLDSKQEELLARAHLNLARYDATIVAAAWFGAAPMVAAAMVGLLI